MSYLLSPVFQGPQLDNNGNLLIGGKLYWYLAGTTTPVTVYQDASGGAAFTQPIILDTRGESAAPIFLQSGQSYKAVLQDSSGVQLNVIDNIQGVNDVTMTTGTFTSINVDGTGNPAKIYQGASGDLEIATNQSSGAQGIYRFRNNLFQTPLGFSVDASGNVTATGGSLTAAGAVSVLGDVTYGTGSLTSTGGLVTSKGSLTGSGLTLYDASVMVTAGFTGYRNKVVNGAMLYDQRQNGSAYSSLGTATLDTWSNYLTGTGRCAAQRSSDAPANHLYSQLVTVTTAAAATPAATDVYQLQTAIEGYSTLDLGWGAASPSSVYLSFWVKSSQIGTYAVSLWNTNLNRSYTATYTVNVANTWEYKSILISGETSGSWFKDDRKGIQLTWDLGSGSNMNTANPNTWVSGAYYRRTSACVNWASTLSNTFRLAGVQLEKATANQAAPTPFEYLPGGIGLDQCQRYLYVINADGISGASIGLSQVNSLAAQANCPFRFPVTMRGTPIMSYSAAADFVAMTAANPPVSVAVSALTYAGLSASGGELVLTIGAGLAAGNASMIRTANSTARVIFTAEL